MGKIFVLGAFAYRTALYDGQTIKTRNLLDLLKNNHLDVDYYDTQDFKNNKLGILTMFIKICRADYLFYLPAQNSLRIIFPIVYLLSKLSRTKIHYFVVGGWLQEYISDKPKITQYLSKIDGIHSETMIMKSALEATYGFNNVDIFPNFRINNFVPTQYHEDDHLRLVFEARVQIMKGLDTIFAMCDKIINKGLSPRISLSIYGPLLHNTEDEEFLKSGLTKYPFIHYYGPLEPERINITLEKYDVLLLPTHYYTEGLPGSVLDAYISGIPVIVTNWKHATEFVDNEKTGYIIPFDDNGDILFERVTHLLDEPEILLKMKQLARNRWHDFSSDKAWQLINGYLS